VQYYKDSSFRNLRQYSSLLHQSKRTTPRPAMLPEGFPGKGKDCPSAIAFLIIFSLHI